MAVAPHEVAVTVTRAPHRLPERLPRLQRPHRPTATRTREAREPERVVDVLRLPEDFQAVSVRPLQLEDRGIGREASAGSYGRNGRHGLLPPRQLLVPTC